MSKKVLINTTILIVFISVCFLLYKIKTDCFESGARVYCEILDDRTTAVAY